MDAIPHMRRPNITAMVLWALGALNMALAIVQAVVNDAITAPWAPELGLAGVLQLQWLHAPAARSLFAIGLAMVAASAIWAFFDARHDRRLMDGIDA